MLLGVWRDSGIKPAALKKKPKLKGSDPYYWQAFWELSSSRPRGDSFGPVPIDKYESYWNSFGVYGVEERARFLRIVSAIDAAYVEKKNEERQKELEKMKQKPSGGKGSLRLG